MRKVHPGDVHPILNELKEGGGLPGDRADGADNARQPHLVGCAVHVQVRNKLHLNDARYSEKKKKTEKNAFVLTWVACSLALSWQDGTSSIFSKMDWGKKISSMTN